MRAVGLVLLILGAAPQDTKPEDEISAEVVRIFGALDRQAKNAWQRVPPPGEKPVEWPARQVWRADPTRPAQLRLGNGVRLDLQSASEVSLVRTKSKYCFNLQKGECLFDIGFTSGKAPDEAVEVVLPNGEVLVPAATKAFVRVICRLDKEKDHVAVLNGAVTIKTKEEKVDVRQGEGIEVDSKAAGLKPKKEDVATQAAWTRWEEKQRAKKSLLKDGDMESAKVDAWIPSDASVNKELREIFDGRQSLKIVSLKKGAYAWQDIQVSSGTRLRVSGWVKAASAFKEWISPTKTALNVDLGTPGLFSANEWGHVEYDVQVPKPLVLCRIVLPCLEGEVSYWDSIVVTVEER